MTRLMTGRFGALLLVAAIAACGGDKAGQTEPQGETNEQPAVEAPANPAAEQAAAEEARQKLAEDNLRASEAYLTENAARDEVTRLPSGLQFEVVETGVEGNRKAEPGDWVRIHFTGKHADGELFQSTRDQGPAARFPLVDGRVPGWIYEAVPLMKAGDRYIFSLPPDLAYGEQGTPNGLIGPNEALIYDVELLSVSDPETYLAESTSFLEENAKKDAVKVTDSGLQYEVVETDETNDRKPRPTDDVAVEYKGMLIDGTEFDSSQARGAPAKFNVADVIPGWIEGLQLMSVGDTYKFYIPPDLAYGEAGEPRGIIAPNEALVFEVTLLEAKESEAAVNLEAAKEFLKQNRVKADVETTDSGLQYKVLEKADETAPRPTTADRVKVHYRGTLIDGTEFDSSYARNFPTEFGVGQVISGWTEGLQLMREGEKFQFFIPPDLAYGERGTGDDIGPNAALIFEVELLEVIKPGEDDAAADDDAADEQP